MPPTGTHKTSTPVEVSRLLKAQLLSPFLVRVQHTASLLPVGRRKGQKMEIRLLLGPRKKKKTKNQCTAARKSQIKNCCFSFFSLFFSFCFSFFSPFFSFLSAYAKWCFVYTKWCFVYTIFLFWGAFFFVRVHYGVLCTLSGVSRTLSGVSCTLSFF